MKISKRIIASIVWIIVGIVLTICSFLNLVDSYWSGMGTALLIVGILQVIRFVRYQKNPSYKETVDTNAQDERNRFIAMKAWSWAGYLLVMIAAVASIALRALGYNDYSMIASLCVCIILALYWVSYWILKKKY